MSRTRFFRICFWCLLGAVLVLALAPSGSGPSGAPLDKLNHLLAFFVLSSLARLLWPAARTALLLALLIGLGAAIELLQLAMDLGRDADWWDLAADVAATVVGLLCGRFLLAVRSRRAAAN